MLCSHALNLVLWGMLPRSVMILWGGDSGLSNSTGKFPLPKERSGKDENFFWSGTTGRRLTWSGSWWYKLEWMVGQRQKSQTWTNEKGGWCWLPGPACSLILYQKTQTNDRDPWSGWWVQVKGLFLVQKARSEGREESKTMERVSGPFLRKTLNKSLPFSVSLDAHSCRESVSP